MPIIAITEKIEQEKIQPELDELKRKALYPTVFKLDKAEINAIDKFAEKHGIGKCAAFPDSTGACFTYSFMPTGIGMNTWIECSCGEKKYITDLSHLDDDDVYCEHRKHSVYRWVCLKNCEKW